MAILSNINSKNAVALLDGGGATPLPQIKSGSSGSSGSSSATTYGNWLENGVSGQKQTLEFRVGQDEPVAQNLPAQAGQDAQRVNLSAGTNSASGATGTGAATEQKAYAGAWAGSEPIDSYEEFLRNKESAYGSMRDEQTQFYDEQSQKALAAIEAQRQAAIAEANNQKTMVDTAATEQKNAALAEAENQKNLLITMSEEQKNAVYKFAEEQRISDMNYAAQQYQLLLDSINAQRESGMAMATEQRDLLLSMSEEQRNAIYAAAESQRVAAEQRADVERERGVVDARSSYEQNKASYGANAEAMGSMGLSGSGYSDYLNSKAYAQQRAETQAANAQADASKREARYTEDQARLKADSDYYQNKYNAEQAYSDRKYQIDTTYQTNMLNAEQNKAQSIYEAENAERDAKYSADSAHAQNEYAAESGYSQSKYEAESAERDAKLQAGLSYSENLFNAESQARTDKLAAEQTADAGKFSAEMSYQQNLLDNDDDIGKHRLEQEQKGETEAQYARAAYTELLSGANSGTYTAEQLEQLAADYGLSDAQKQSLINAANDYTTKKQAAANAELSASTGDIAGTVQSAIDNGSITKEQGQQHLYNSYKDEIAYGSADTGAIDAAYSKGQISEAQYNDLKARWNSNIETSADFFYSNGTMLNKSAAKQALDNLTKQPWLSAENKSALNAAYGKLYTPIIGGQNADADADELGDDGNNFNVRYGKTEYEVESAGECTDTNIKEVASSVADDDMFGYQGKIYIKKDGKVYEIRGRGDEITEDWSELYGKFFGNGDPTTAASATAASSSAKSGYSTTSSGKTYTYKDSGGNDKTIESNTTMEKSTNSAGQNTTTTTTVGKGENTTIKETKTEYDHGGSTKTYEITDENGNTKKITTIRGH